ncbi:MAG: hypothetical protein FWB75_08965, partial [Oscillospiraceae bacterium]|nr:hypothetical protein [Oscillospiraceae bacterium]
IGASVAGLSLLETATPSAEARTTPATPSQVSERILENATIPQAAPAVAVAAAATEPDEVPNETDGLDYAGTQAEFVPPSVTVLKSPFQQGQIPENILTMDEAAQIAARYIWDVFGACIDGMYVQLMYSNWPGVSRAYWNGTVASSAELLDRTSDDFEFKYFFFIDAETGMRVNISNATGRRGAGSRNVDMCDDMIMAQRRSPLMLAFMDFDLEERIAALGLSQEMLDTYTQTALEFAQRHFYNSEVVEFGLAGAWSINASIAFDAKGNESLNLEILNFTAIDDTGREASVTITSENSQFSDFVSISSQQADLIEGFYYSRPGRG